MDLRKAEAQVDKIEILTNVGVVLAGIFAGLIAYGTKKPPKTSSDSLVTSIGAELGNRFQTDLLIAEVKRCADSLAVLADRKREATEEKLEEILERLDEREEREKEARRR